MIQKRFKPQAAHTCHHHITVWAYRALRAATPPKADMLSIRSRRPGSCVASDFGIEGLERCFHNVPENVTKIVHMCCGYPDHLDDEEYKKADPDSYHRLARHVDAMGIDQVSIEDAHCCNDLVLLESFERMSVIFGSVAVARSRIETVDEVEARIRSALNHIDRERLVVAPDCGLGLLPPELAEAKLKVMCSAAARI